MIRNKALNFIIQKIQWGEAKAGTTFYSEKELAIKLNVSKTTAKNALNFAESIQLLKSQRGSRRVVEDFTRNVFLTKYLTISNKKEIEVVKSKECTKVDKAIFTKHFKHKIGHTLKIDLKWKKEIVATFYSSTPNKPLYNSFTEDAGSFLDFLKDNKIIIDKIEKETFYRDGYIYSKRLLYDRAHKLLEEGILIIKPQYFLRKRVMCFFSSGKE